MQRQRTAAKQLLTNSLRHADTLNRVQEEREMWRQRQLELQCHYKKVDRQRRAPLLVRGRLVSDTVSPSQSPKRDSSPSSYYWTRMLMKEEESDPFRWGHSGYKELHPEEFESTDEDKSVREKSRDGGKVKKKKKYKRQRKKRKRHDDSSSEDPGRGCRKHKAKDKRAKALKRDGSESDSGFISRRHTTTKKRSKKVSSQVRDKSAQRDNSSTLSDSDSESSYTNHDQPRRKRRRNE